ncbi:MAG: hypothetical protein GXY44_06130 [Phycisphaerales bacterium]|nr:hypothetical protein [Phycisphaerales bacterium]
MDCRVNLCVEVEQVGNGLAISKPVPVQIVYRGKLWQAECMDPPIETDAFEHMEQAVVAGARAVHAELQAQVIETPMIVGKITPERVLALF